jgi:hypothetical protein
LWVLVIVSSALGAVACVPGAAGPATDSTPVMFDSGFSRSPVATPTPFIPMLIDEIVLSTQVSANGVPVDARTALPVNTPVAYLNVLARDVVGGTAFAALWLREGAEIGRSRHDLPAEPEGPPMEYRVIVRVNSADAQRHAFDAQGPAPVVPTQEPPPEEPEPTPEPAPVPDEPAPEPTQADDEPPDNGETGENDASDD